MKACFPSAFDPYACICSLSYYNPQGGPESRDTLQEPPLPSALFSQASRAMNHCSSVHRVLGAQQTFPPLLLTLSECLVQKHLQAALDE